MAVLPRCGYPADMSDLDELDRLPTPSRRVYCNRTLNLRGIAAVGCDMDYTLVHYRSDLWEARAYAHARDRMLGAGYPLEACQFQPDLVTRGLVLDLALGNIVKASRFGYVMRASHGTTMLDHEALRRSYARVLVDLSEPRWVFLNTLFSLSEGCLYAQLVDLLDLGKLPAHLGYSELYGLVQRYLGEAHTEGELKAEIVADPERFVVRDPELPQTLLDFKHAGKRLMLITNSEWAYTRHMLSFVLDPYLPAGMDFRALFDLIIVEARKPNFFTQEAALFELVDEERGLFRPQTGPMQAEHVYLGGHARLVENFLGVPGEEILYVGDHLYADVHVSKAILRWRTALIVHELEHELQEQLDAEDERARLRQLMDDKERAEHHYARLRQRLLRYTHGQVGMAVEQERVRAALAQAKERLRGLDLEVAPLAASLGRRFNARWGSLMRAGNDKSRLARMIERYSDVYMSRVSNLSAYGPFAYLRAPGGSLPHDSTPE